MSEHRAGRLSTDSQTLLASGPEAPSNHLSVGSWEPLLHSYIPVLLDGGPSFQLEVLGIYNVSLKSLSQDLGDRAVNQLSCNPGSDFCPCQNCLYDTAQA